MNTDNVPCPDDSESPAAKSALVPDSLPFPVPARQVDWLLDGQAPLVSAAQVAAEFVAQMFADVSTPASALAAAAAAAAAEAQVPPAETAPDTPTDPLTEQQRHPLQGQNILVLGLGDSGLAMARWCVRGGAAVTVADTRAAPPQLATLQAELPQVRFIAGAFDAALVDDQENGQALDAIYRSPGLSPASISPILIAASARGIRAGGELSLYSLALRTLKAAQGYAPAVLAITGTNGKTR